MRLGSRFLAFALLSVCWVTSPLVSAPESAKADPKGKAAQAKTSDETTPSTKAQGPVKQGTGASPTPVTPPGVTTVVVPNTLGAPTSRTIVNPRPKSGGVLRLAEKPKPKVIAPRATGFVDPDTIPPRIPPQTLPVTPPLSISFDSLDFDSNISNTGSSYIPPDSHGVAGPAHVVNVTNVSISVHSKVTGAVLFEDSLAAFFAGLSPLTDTFDPKVMYDQFEGRFVVVTLERTAVSLGAAADTSRLFIAVSEDDDPSGTWYLTAVDGSEVFFNPNVAPSGDTADHFLDYPSLAVDEEAVYVTGNLFTFDTGDFGGVRLWIVDKESGSGGLYDGGAADVTRFNPYGGCDTDVDCFEMTTQPAHIFGIAPSSPTNVGTWLVGYSGLSDGGGPGFDEYVQVLRVDDPIGPGTTTFTVDFTNVGDIEDPFSAPLPGADQLGSTVPIATNGRRALQAVWRDSHELYLVATILPEAPDPDSGQATAHWFQIDSSLSGSPKLIDQGNVGGEDIHASGGVHTFFPSISVNSDDTVAIGFSASSDSIYAGSYYTTRLPADPAGTTGSSFALRAGLAPYVRTFCSASGSNRWGDYSGMSIDPIDQCFWVYNQHALAVGSTSGAPCQPSGFEDGRWGTAFGKFCAEACGNGSVRAGETCDPPGDPAGPNSNLCRADCTMCGDGVVDGSEDCDDTNTVDTDACRNDCTAPICGDGIVDAGEGCDDGNAIAADGCESDCTITAVCGDSIVTGPDETCDPPGSPAGVHGYECRVDCKVCGDGIVDPGEDCDDANTDDFDGCRNDCSTPRCGDGIVDAPEETCDPPGQPAGAAGNNCDSDCTVCGDGIVDADEVCDDGNADDLDACRNDCNPPVCGDGIVDAGEACDDGNAVPGDGCETDCTLTPVCGDGDLNVAGETCEPPGQPAGANGNDCRVDCTVCGDGVVDAGEDCDDANTDDLDGCRNDCTVPTCGDSILDPGETCDPPGQPGGAIGNDCRGDCSVCGDGVQDPVEECDDGNAFNFDACRNSCVLPICGDGLVDLSEDCDDGNQIPGDGCEPDCTETPECGDLAVNAPGETCDPPGQPAGANGNDCREDCTVCGDGVLDAGEECDDGNSENVDGCRNDCLLPVCGDGIVDPGQDETCDPPSQPAGANGNACRGNCTVCGDGIVDDGEACDDGNTDNLDACRNDCVLPVCGDGITDPGEACDDGNQILGDGCENDCTVTPICGDDEVNAPGETCDPPGQPGGANGNDCRGDCTVCGDGVVDLGEDCDDGNTDDFDACRNNCTIPICGDELVDVVNGETCDPPGTPSGPVGNDCRADCTVCGDGIVDAGEECDDGNALGFDGCRNDCTAPACGDGIVDANEDCDDGNAIPGDGCEPDCTDTPVCGNLIVDGDETCDPPGAPAGASGNLCRGDCTVCGDGVVDAGEACDDGNSVNEDACRNDCVVPVCGDGIVDPGEECDDGNGTADDGCEPDCTVSPVCGDGDINVAGETCEPPGEPAGASGNTCRLDCTVCGDGVVDHGEGCDDGNNIDDDDCANDCTPVGCGDGEVVGPDETCDPPGSPAGGSGNNCRGDCTVCGDGIVNGDEECDDGNLFNFDFCHTDCKIPACGDGIFDPASEECDDNNTVDGDGCESNCTITPAGSLTSMIFDRVPGEEEITMSWGPSCRATDTDFALYEGQFPIFNTHVPFTCSTGDIQVLEFVPATYSTYYLLVPHNALAEGSYGTDSLGNPRAISTAACKQQRFEVCE